MPRPQMPKLLPRKHTRADTILEDAMEVLSDENRWIKRAFQRTVRELRDDDKIVYVPGQFCLLGAIEFSAGNDMSNRQAVWVDFSSKKELAVKFVHKAISDKIKVRQSVIGFNDDPKTTHDDILDVLLSAIQIAKEVETSY